MRAILLTVLLLGTGLAGCIGDDDALSPTAVPEVPVEEPRVVHFQGDTLLEEPSEGVPQLSARTVLTGFQGAEPSIGILPSGTIFVQAWDETLRSTDGGETWASVYTFESVTGGGSNDPMLWVDPATERVYWNHMWPLALVVPGACSAIGWSSDEGDTWERNDAACGLPNIDFQKLGGGPPGPDPNPMAGAEYPSVLYLCYGKPNVGVPVPVCAPSYDGGETWLFEVPIPCGATTESLACPALSAPPAVGPDGTAYLPAGGNIGAGCESMVATSTDSGLTWTPVPGPRTPLCVWIHDLDVAPDGTLYALGTTDGVAYIASSSDQGATWEGPWRVSPPTVAYSMPYFSSVGAGDDGRIGVALIGTSNPVDHHNDAPDGTQWHLHLVTSEDMGAPDPTFTAVQATSDPVQVGSICLFRESGCNGEPDRNLLEFIDSTVAPDGTFYVAYTDGCTGRCAADPDAASPEDSRDDATAVAWVEGWTLNEGVAT